MDDALLLRQVFNKMNLVEFEQRMSHESEKEECQSVTRSGRADKEFKTRIGTLRCSRKGKQKRRLGSS